MIRIGTTENGTPVYELTGAEEAQLIKWTQSGISTVRGPAWGLMFDWLEATQAPVCQDGEPLYTVQLRDLRDRLPLMVMRRSPFDRCTFVLY